MCGGNFEGDDLTVRGQNFAVTKDGGKTWTNLEQGSSPGRFGMRLLLDNKLNMLEICLPGLEVTLHRHRVGCTSKKGERQN